MQELRTKLFGVLKLQKPKWQTTAKRTFSTQEEENILYSPYKSVPVPTQNVSDFCMSRFDQYSSLPALVCGASGKEFTYGDVKNLSRKFGSQLMSNGLKPGDKIAVIVPNCPEFGPALFGATGVGVTVLPISPLLTPTEIAKVFAIAEPKLIVTCDALVACCAGHTTLDTSSKLQHVTNIKGYIIASRGEGIVAGLE